MVALAGLVMGFVGATLYGSMGIWGVALMQEFGWSAWSLAISLSISRVLDPLMSPVAGYLTDRIGPRRTVLVGLCVLSVGLMFFSLTSDLLTYYLAFALMAIGAMLAGWIPLTTLLVHWFVRRRSLAMGVFKVGELYT